MTATEVKREAAIEAWLDALDAEYAMDREDSDASTLVAEAQYNVYVAFGGDFDLADAEMALAENGGAL